MLLLTFRLAGSARTGEFDGPGLDSESEAAAEFFGGGGKFFVLGLDHGAAMAADKKLHSVVVIRMAAGDEGASGLKPVDQAVMAQKIEAAIDAGRRDRLVVRQQDIAQLVGGERALSGEQEGEHSAALRGEAAALAAANGLILAERADRRGDGDGTCHGAAWRMIG